MRNSQHESCLGSDGLAGVDHLPVRLLAPAWLGWLLPHRYHLLHPQKNKEEREHRAERKRVRERDGLLRACSGCWGVGGSVSCSSRKRKQANRQAGKQDPGHKLALGQCLRDFRFRRGFGPPRLRDRSQVVRDTLERFC